MSTYVVISGPYFPVFGLNTGKYGPEITYGAGHFMQCLGLFFRSVLVSNEYPGVTSLVD